MSDDDDDVIVSVCCHGPTRERDLKERKGGTMAVRPSSVKRIGCLMVTRVAEWDEKEQEQSSSLYRSCYVQPLRVYFY